MQTDTTRLGPSFGRRARWLAVAAVLALGFSACGDDDDDDAAPDQTEADSPDAPEDPGDAGEPGDAGSGGGAPVAYEVTDLTYSDVAAPAGGTIEIVNTSGTSHTFTADDGAFDVNISGDETATVDVPADSGEYPFHCELHASMEATLTVE